jgi:beta-lactam-binding protein with PASTA domain
MSRRVNKILLVLAILLLVAVAVWATVAIMQRTGNTDYRDMQTYIGLTEEQGIERAEAGGLEHRVVERDGESYMVTQDFSNDRVNFTVADDHITKAEIY